MNPGFRATVAGSQFFRPSRTAACTSEGNACNGCAWARPPTSDASEIKPRKRLIVRLQKKTRNPAASRCREPQTKHAACSACAGSRSLPQLPARGDIYRPTASVRYPQSLCQCSFPRLRVLRFPIKTIGESLLRLRRRKVGSRANHFDWRFILDEAKEARSLQHR
jgi:hypothetical protein